MPVKQPKEAVMTRLDADDYAWVERQALAFGDRSTVLNRVVKVVRAMIANGSLRWDLETLQALLQESRCNFASSSSAKAEREKRVRTIRLPNVHLFTGRGHARPEVRAMEAYQLPFRAAR